MKRTGPKLQPDLALLLRANFGAFVRKAFPTLHGGEKLGKEPYLDYLFTQLTGVANGDIRRLLINLPPRHLKTEICSVCLPLWMLTKRPATRVMVVAGSERLVGTILGCTRQIIHAPWFKELSGIRLVKDQLLNVATSAGGGVIASSIDASITGLGGDVIILDDPVQIQDAAKLERLSEVNQRFDTVIRSRLNNPRKGRIVVVAHRLHTNDLTGHLLNAGGWHHVSLPMIANEVVTYQTDRGPWHRKAGDPLRPEEFDPAEAEQDRATMYNPDFDTFKQQDPSGGIAGRFTRDHIGWFPRARLARLQLPVVLSVDPGDRGGPANSYNVIQAWSTDGENYYLVDQFRDQCGYKKFRKHYMGMVGRHNPSVVLIEQTAQGSRLIDDARGKPWPQIEPITPRRSKVARFRVHLDILLAERIKLPPGAEGVEDFILECVKFPHGKFDDQVDAMTQALDYLSKNKVPTRPVRAVSIMASRGGHLMPTLAKQSQKLNGQSPGVVAGGSRGGGYLY